MARTNYAVVDFSEHLGNRQSDLPSEVFRFVGDRSTTKEFMIGGEPRSDLMGYLLMQIFHVQNLDHRILINGTDLTGNDILPITSSRYWHIWMDVFRTEVLHEGVNTIQVLRAPGGDNFYVGNIVVHWTERD